MWIKHCRFTEPDPRDWLVKGNIEIQGEFSRAEWEKIRESFILMGLFQVGHVNPHRTLPTRAEVVNAIMENARGHPESLQLLEKKFPHVSINFSTGQIVLRKPSPESGPYDAESDYCRPGHAPMRPPGMKPVPIPELLGDVTVTLPNKRPWWKRLFNLT